MPARRLLVVTALAVVTLTGCVTGERPTLGPMPDLGGSTGTPVGDAGVDKVLGLLEAAQRGSPTTFTAVYGVTRKLGPLSVSGTVVRDGGNLSITLGDVRYLVGGASKTCTVSTGACEAGLLEQRTSDVTVGSGFFAASPARALRVAYARKTGPAVPSQQTVAGIAVDCVDILAGAGTERYCATPAGPLALWDTADKTVTLAKFETTADPNAFLPSPKPNR
ncbi:MAG TPA: hypothetical protein VF855_13865 [Acidimicrobiales bacterium]